MCVPSTSFLVSRPSTPCRPRIVISTTGCQCVGNVIMPSSMDKDRSMIFMRLCFQDSNADAHEGAVSGIRLPSPWLASEESRSNPLAASPLPTRECGTSALCRLPCWEVHQSRCTGRVADAAPDCVSHDRPPTPEWIRVRHPRQVSAQLPRLRHRARAECSPPQPLLCRRLASAPPRLPQG